jgi:hypothetical protein
MGYADGHLLVEYADGQRLNVPVADLVARYDPNRTGPAPSPSPAGVPCAAVGATRYRFAAGDVLAEHAHDAASLHDIYVERGRVVVRCNDGEVLGLPGDRFFIEADELHSVEALEDSVTLHTLTAV